MIGISLQTLVLLGVFSGLPHLPFPRFGARHPRPVATAADSLPPPWKAASRLALESQFVRGALPGPGTARLRVQGDPRRLHVTVDPDSGTISAVTEVGEYAVGPGAMVPFTSYGDISVRESFRRQWTQRSQQSLNTLGTAGAQTPARATGLSFQFPSPLPSKIQSLLGPGGPALNVSGSENIKLSGQSNWSNQQTGLLGQKRSLFPSLDMQQDLNIRLEGQLSDRIRVNLLQNSITPIPLSNRIAINYRGDEDDLVQQFDLGNTSLTLPNTQYVSYSGRNEGLFGAKSALRYGPLDLTVLASKQEGRSERASYAGGASKQSRPLADMDYLRGVYYFLYDPNEPAQSIDEASIRLFKDDNNYGNASNKVRGRAIVDPRLPADPARRDTVFGSFALLNPGPDKDYEILNDVYGPLYKVVRLRQALNGEQRLAVTYRYRADANPASALFDMGAQDDDTTSVRTMKLLRAPGSVLKPDSLNPSVFDTDAARAPFNPVRELELKNFYDLSGQRIDPLTLKISIRRGQGDPPVTNASLANGTPVPYIEALGLDNLDESGGNPKQGHDGRVDGTLITSNSRLFVDYINGTLFFPDLRPFAPRLSGAGARPFEAAIGQVLTRRAALDNSLGEQNASNPGVYDKYNPQRSVDSRYFIDVEFTAQRSGGDIYLGRSNLVEGSDVVTINNQPLVRERDYTIDYEIGRVTLKRQPGPTDNLNIDYSYAPLFAQAGRTLIGSAFKVQGRDRSLGGAFLYESKGAQDLRPRLGEEPSRSVIGDLNTTMDFKPEWLTRLVDRLPGVRTTTPSNMNVQAEVGMSFPNPNTRNEVFVDDMEGVRDALSVSMGPERWRLSSVPSVWNPTLGSAHSVLDDSLKTAEVHWYTPLRAVQEKDLKPNLTNAQGAQNYRQVLALSLPRRPAGAVAGDSLWAGLTYPLDVAGFDVSRSQFIELWVNDWNDKARVRDPNVRLHIDLGVVSEDMMRSPLVRPEGGAPNTEDKFPPDNQLTVTDKNDEDTGYDGLTNDEEISAGLPILDLSTAGPGDPSGDDFHGTDDRFKELDPRRYRYTNGTEGNKAIYPNPDTEDLNLNQILDTQEDYIEYTIGLGDGVSPYLVTDVQQESQAGRYPPVASDNGWRRYRIPLNDPRAVRFGTPNLTLARHVRVWIEGVREVDPLPVGEVKEGDVLVKPYLVLGGLDIVGSRWQAVELPKPAVLAGTTQTLNAVNNLDNADIYQPPFLPGQTRSGNQEVTRREQSIALEFTQLQPRDTLAAFKTFSIDENYSRYGNLQWYIAAYNVPGHAPGDSLRYFVRFSSDEIERNYYEFSAPMPPSSPARDPGGILWEAVNLKLTDISNLKLAPNYRDIDTTRYDVPNSRTRYTIVGRPSFTRLRRISFGIINADTMVAYSEGQLWFNEIRATDIAKDVDRAGRVLVNGTLANLMRYNASFDGRGADFLAVGQSRGSGNAYRALSLGTSVDVHRFFEGTGIVMPSNFTYSDNSTKPRFTAGDDVVRIGALSAASETRNINRTWNVAYSRVWNERSNPFLRFWLNGLTSSLSGGQSNSRSPSAVGTSRSLGAAVNYSLTPRRYLPVSLPLTKMRLFPLPERAWWNYALGTSRSRNVERRPDGTLGRTLNDVTGRVATIDFGADSRPIDMLHHTISGTRNLTLAAPLLERVGFVNLGRVVTWRQAVDASYALNRGTWLRPTMAWNAGYNQNNGPELSPDLSVRAIGNHRTLRFTWDFPFERLPGSVRAPLDTGQTAAPALWRRLLGHLGTISTDAQFNQSSSYSRVSGTPAFSYLFGFADDPGLKDRSRVVARFGNTYGRADDWRAGGRTRVTLPYGTIVSVRGDFTAQHGISNGVVSRRGTQRFPSLEFDYGRLTRTIRLDRFLKNPQLRTSYDRARSTDYLNNSDRPSIISTSSDWRPLIGISGELRNGTRTDLQIERRVTQDENHSLGNSLKTTRNANVRFSLARTYSQGQKVTFLGKETTVRSTVGLGLNANYSRNSGEIKLLDGGGREIGKQSPFEDDRLAVNGTGSYGFSNNVTGNLLIGFGQDRDLQRDIVRRNVLVELRASFTF